MDEDPGCYYILVGAFLLAYTPAILSVCGATWLSFAIIAPVGVAAVLAPTLWRWAGRGRPVLPDNTPAYLREIEKLGELRSTGVLTKAEFEAKKAQVLALSARPELPSEVIPAALAAQPAAPADAPVAPPGPAPSPDQPS